MLELSLLVVLLTGVGCQDSYGAPKAPISSPTISTTTSQGSYEPPINKPQYRPLGSFSGAKTNSLPKNTRVQQYINSFRAGPSTETIPGGIDFNMATRQQDGRLCVVKQETVESLQKDPILECKHRDVKKCHVTYITYFKPTQEQKCEENFEKICQITFKQEAVNEKIKMCYQPHEKDCNGNGPEQCKTVFESYCSTKYGAGWIGNTTCEKVPVEICGKGCVSYLGPEVCHEKEVTSLVDVPMENCDLSPQKSCRMITRLVPSLKPKQECTIVPQETCLLKFTSPKKVRKPLRSEWCIEDEVSDQDSYGAPLATVLKKSSNDVW